MRKLFKAFATVTLVSVITRLLSFVFKIYLSRKLGAEILGLYQICMSVFMLFACICCSGLPVTLSRITAESDAIGDTKKQFGSVSTCLLAGVLLTLFMVSVLLTFPQILDFVFTDARCKKLFMIMLPMLLTSCIYAVLRGWFWGKKYFGIFSVTEFADEVLKVLFAVILLEGGILAISKEYAYAAAMLAGDIIIIIIILILFFVKKGKLKRPAMAKEIAKSATPLTVTRIVGSLTSTFISLVLPSLLVSSCGLSANEATAEFGRASGMVMPLLFTPTSIIGSLGVVLIPEIASANAERGVGPLSKSLSGAIAFSCLVACYFFALFTAVGEELATKLYDDPKSGEYLAFAAIIVVPMCINGLVVSMLNSMGKELNTFISHVASCALLIVVLLITPKYLGVKAYFVALGVFHSVAMIINLIMLNKYSGLDLKAGFKCCAYMAYSTAVTLIGRYVLSLLEIPLLLKVAIGGIGITLAFVPLALSVKSLKLAKRVTLKNRVFFL